MKNAATKNAARTAWIASIAFIAMTSIASARVTVDRSAEADMTNYETYTIVENSAVDEQMRARVIEAIEEEFSARGVEQVDEGGDLKIVVHGSSHEEVRITEDPWPYDGVRHPRAWRARHRFGIYDVTAIDIHTRQMGTLTIDAIDHEADQMVWRGVAEESIPRKTEKIEKRIDKVVAKIFSEVQRAD